MNVLLLGGTGRTGSLVLTQMLARGVPVRAIVRSATGVTDPLLTEVQADLLDIGPGDLRRHLEGCDTVISCLGHRITMRGIFGPPRDLVERAVRNVCHARGSDPLRLILMSTVSVNRPEHADTRRGAGERAVLAAIRAVMPPARDNQRAADFLIGLGEGAVEWSIVRPDTLKPGGITDYSVNDELVSTLFRPAQTNMANVADFMCELTTDQPTWERWRYQLPVITNRSSS